MKKKLQMTLIKWLCYFMIFILAIMSLVILINMVINCYKAIIVFLVAFAILMKLDRYLEKNGIDLVPLEEDWI